MIAKVQIRDCNRRAAVIARGKATIRQRGNLHATEDSRSQSRKGPRPGFTIRICGYLLPGPKQPSKQISRLPRCISSDPPLRDIRWTISEVAPPHNASHLRSSIPSVGALHKPSWTQVAPTRSPQTTRNCASRAERFIDEPCFSIYPTYPPRVHPGRPSLIAGVA